MVKSAWWDIDKRGRRWESIFKQIESKYWTAIKENNIELAESYERRLTIIEKIIQPYVIDVTGIRKIITEYNKVNPPKLMFHE
jgi:hypothetical protein